MLVSQMSFFVGKPVMASRLEMFAVSSVYSVCSLQFILSLHIFTPGSQFVAHTLHFTLTDFKLQLDA